MNAFFLNLNFFTLYYTDIWATPVAYNNTGLLLVKSVYDVH